MEFTYRLLAAAVAIISALGFTVSAQTGESFADPNAPIVDYANPKQYIIDDVSITGIQYGVPAVILTRAGISRGDTITIPGDYLSSAMKRIMELNQFSDVQIYIDPLEGDRVNLEIRLAEQPIVMEWNYRGLYKAERKEIAEKLNLRIGRPRTDFILNSSREAIIKFLKEKGFLNAEVEILQQVDTSSKNGVNITFDVSKNGRVKVGEITFEGNEAFADRRLRRSFKKIHPASINFFRNSRLKDGLLAEDKANLLDYYQARGYRNIVIVEDSIYDISRKRIGLLFRLEEGNKFFVRDIKWTGNSLFSTEYLNDTMLMVQKGDLYDKKTINKRLGIEREQDPAAYNISNLYKNDGYIFSSIQPQETVVGVDSVDIDVKIFEGNQARINAIRIAGNMAVDDDVIRRELYVRPGELYDQSMLMQTMQVLNQTRHFQDQSTIPDVSPISSRLVDVAFNLEEAASDQVQVSGGWGYGMFVGSVGIVLNNVSLRRTFKKGEWAPYPRGQGQQLSLRVQTNGTYYKSISANFTEPWLGGKKPTSLTVGTFYSSQNNAVWVGGSSTQHFRTLGVSAGIGRRLAWPDRYFTLYNEVSYQAYNLKEWESFIVANGTSNLFQFKTVFGRNSVDHPYYPRSGSDFSLSLALTPPYSLFSNRDYSDKNLSDQDRHRFIEFHKWLLKGQWFRPLTPDRKLVLMARAEMGYLGAFNRHKVSPFEGFEVGGDGMTGYTIYGIDIVALRGYENGALTDFNQNPEKGRSYSRAYNKYTLELRYPFINEPQSIIFGVIFAEAGNGFNSWKDFDPFHVKRSAGAGIRLYMPVIGLIGFDWGYGFDNAVGSNKRSGSHTHFMIGHSF